MILDIGCGHKEGAVPLSSSKPVIYADILKTDWNKKFLHIVCDAHNLPFKDPDPNGRKLFDIVYASHVLEHCKFPPIVLAEIIRLSSKAIIIVPNLGRMNSIKEEDPMHLYTWTERSFRSFLNLFFTKVEIYQNERGTGWFPTLKSIPLVGKLFYAILLGLIGRTELVAKCELTL